ncbi:MAG: SsrA-binding protein SmpB [Patescibacteria group bacterium]|nr:SsrA-binding protein SmpB [Patescibacteria group bacterium]
MPTLATNRKAGFDYERLEEFEAGLVLTGQEVKSIRDGGAKIGAAHIVLQGGRLRLIGAIISRYKKASAQSPHDSERTRDLLMNAKEIQYLAGKLGQKGLTLIPISLYTRGQRIKVGFWLARGKKTFEKRQKIKSRDLDREISRFQKDDL